MPPLEAFLPTVGRNVEPVRPVTGEVVGHAARFGSGAVRDTEDCVILAWDEPSEACGELDLALSDDDRGCAGSVFQESRTTGGPSSAVKSVSGRS